MKHRIVLLAMLLAMPGLAHGVPATELVQRSNSAAAREDWNTSARALEELVAGGFNSSDVLYNLGTSYARAGRYGEAIWRLEQVALRSPFASDAEQNLRATRLRLAHRDAGRTGRAVVETALPIATWLGELLPLDWAVTFALLFEIAAVASFLMWRRWHGREIAKVAGAAAGIVFAAAALGVSTVVVARQESAEAAIVLHDGLRLLHTPAADAIPEAPVREGDRITLLARDATFVRVQTTGGVYGWLAGHDVGALEE